MDDSQKKKNRGDRLKLILRPWPVYLIMVGVVVGTMYMVRTREAGTADPVLPAAVTLEQNIEIQFQDVIMQGRQKGVQRWVITSPKVSLSRDGRYTYFEPDPKGKFFNLKDWNQTEGTPSDKVRSLDWKAKKAEYDSFTEDLKINGDAVITTDTKDVIKTETVEYSSRQKQVKMPKPVDIRTKDGTTITGDEMIANTDAEVMELRGRVTLETPTKDEVKL